MELTVFILAGMLLGLICGKAFGSSESGRNVPEDEQQSKQNNV